VHWAEPNMASALSSMHKVAHCVGKLW